MNYSIDDQADYLLVRFVGDVDIQSSPGARGVLLDCLNRECNTAVDMSGVTYIDSSGVATLVESFQLAKQRNLEFSLINVSPQVMSVLHLAHLDKAFPIYTDTGHLPPSAGE